MKKVVAILLLGLTLAFAKGGGSTSLGLVANGSGGYGLSGQFGEVQVHLFSTSSGELSFLFYENDLAKFLGVYAGIGAGISLSDNSFGASAIVPLGIKIHVGGIIDLFAEYVPGYTVAPGFGFRSGYNGGIRFIF